MSRYQTVEVEVECEDEHCDDFTALTCPRSKDMYGVIQRAYDRLAPAHLRGADWERDETEPWRTLWEEMRWRLRNASDERGRKRRPPTLTAVAEQITQAV